MVRPRRKGPPRPAARELDPPAAEWLVVVAIACLTWIVFLPALRGGFLPWDDQANLIANRAWRGIGWAQLSWIFANFHMGHWIPVTWLSFNADYLVWGMKPKGYHLTNVLIHSANAGLVCLVGARLRAVGQGPVWRTRSYWLALAAFALALGSKSITTSLPIILLILDLYPLRRWRGAWRARLAEKAPFALLSLIASVVAMVAVRSGGSASTLAELGVWPRLAISAYSLVFYLRKTLVPIGLSPLYELPADFNPLTPVYLVSAAGVIAISAAAVAVRRRSPWLSAAWASYLLMVLPVTGLVQNGPQIAADRYTYLPCLPFAILVGLAVAFVCRWAWALAAPAVALALLAILTVFQIGIWRDAEALWTHALAVSPSAIAYSSMGVVLDEQGKPQEAVAHFDEALRINPRLAHAQNNWGIALARQGKWQDAIAHYEEALRLNPGYTEARLNLAVALERLGRHAEAQQHIAGAQASRP